MVKNHFKLHRSDVPKAAKKSGNSVQKPLVTTKPKRQMSEFDAKLLALKERSTKKLDGTKATRKPLVIAQPTFVVPSAPPVTSITESDRIEDLLPSELPDTLVTPTVTTEKSTSSNYNQYEILADDEDKYKIKLAPSIFNLPARTTVTPYDDADL